MASLDVVDYVMWCSFCFLLFFFGGEKGGCRAMVLRKEVMFVQ